MAVMVSAVRTGHEVAIDELSVDSRDKYGVGSNNEGG
jgi:hypothetical protein